MDRGLVADVSILIKAPAGDVWAALVTPEQVSKYMFGATVTSDWREGGPIVWKGEWQGRAYEDHGRILKLVPQQLLQYSHFSPLMGLPDVPENYHTVTITLSPEGAQTRIRLTQDNNASEQARQHSEKNWRTMLVSLRQLLER